MFCLPLYILIHFSVSEDVQNFVGIWWCCNGFCISFSICWYLWLHPCAHYYHYFRSKFKQCMMFIVRLYNTWYLYTWNYLLLFYCELPYYLPILYWNININSTNTCSKFRMKKLEFYWLEICRLIIRYLPIIIMFKPKYFIQEHNYELLLQGVQGVSW